VLSISFGIRASQRRFCILINHCTIKADKRLGAPPLKATNSRKKFGALCAKSCIGQSILNGRFQQLGHLGEFAPSGCSEQWRHQARIVQVWSRRIVHYNVTAHPTADWTLQQFREAIPSDHSYQFLIHDRDAIFSCELDEELKRSFGLRVLRTPARAPKANAFCERLVGAVRRECLDFMILLNEGHLRMTMRSWSRTTREDGHTPA
jgi:transposase InsO family protein